MRGFAVRVGALVVVALLAAACGGSSAPPPPPPPPTPPPPPASVTALPRDGSAQVSWPGSAGATSYALYYGTSAQVTTAATRVPVAGTSVTVPSLLNGTPYWFAAAALGEHGEGALSPVACAVPTAADQAGLTLHDPLCGETLDGARWWPDGPRSAGVVGGAAELHAEMDGMEPFAANGSLYGTSLSVNAGNRRVTTLRATISVPRATAAAAGDQVQVRASVRLRYSQPADRLLFPRALQDMLAVEVGLVDQGSGLKAFRSVYHCDDASCATSPSTGVAFADPAGWADEAGLRVAPAAYDTAYTFEVRLAEGEGADGVFHWSVAGGAFGAGVSGSADPAEYLAGAAWSGVPIAGAGSTAFEAAQLRVFTLDRSPAGGGSGRITASFDDVAVGLDDAPAAAFDDFSSGGGNSGPAELSTAKWASGGAGSAALSDGSLLLRDRVTGTGQPVSALQALSLADPASINTLQADVRITSTASAGAQTNANGLVQGRFYYDGTPGAAPGSAVGDVLAGVFLNTAQDRAIASVNRCLTPTCSGAVGPVASSTFPTPLGSGWHTVRVSWNPATQRFTMALDGATVTLDPGRLAPMVGPAHAPMRRIGASLGTPPTAGVGCSVEARVNNVFTAP